MTPLIWDSGLQNERTNLAWSRSALSLLWCGLLVARLAAELHPIAALVTIGLAGVLCGASHHLARRRYVRAWSCLDAGVPLPDGREGAILLIGLLVLGTLSTLFVTLQPLGLTPGG